MTHGATRSCLGYLDPLLLLMEEALTRPPRSLESSNQLP